MQSQTVSVWFDRDGDMLEVLWGFREGFFAPTEDDRILKRLDNDGNLIGFLVHEFSTLPQDSPAEFTLEAEPIDEEPVAVTVRSAAEELGVSERRIRQLVGQGRVLGASKAGHEWIIPTPIQVAYGTRGPMGVAQRVAEQQAAYHPAGSSTAPPDKSSPRGRRGRSVEPGRKTDK